MHYVVLLIIMLFVANQCSSEPDTKSVANHTSKEVGAYSENYILTYQELVDYPSQCGQASSQLAYLKKLQRIKNFDPDPDKLSYDDRLYNSRLKATIWWYVYRCKVTS
jgi:hypothetical protein